jgi:hypothetical protein
LSVRAAILAMMALSMMLSAAARAEGLDDARSGTRGGGAPEELQRHFGARGPPLAEPVDFGDSYAPPAVRCGFQEAYDQIDKPTHALKRIQPELPRHMVNAGAFCGVFLALDAEYSAPDRDCGTLPGPTTGCQGAAEYVGMRGGAVIRAIFRDTTPEALEGCNSPACRLTAQLLLRIGPPTADRGRRPPPLSTTQLRAPSRCSSYFCSCARISPPLLAAV